MRVAASSRAAVAAVVAAATLGSATVLAADHLGSPAAPEPRPDRPARAAPLPGRVLDTVGVVSYNAYHRLPVAQAREDWDRLTSDPAVDLIGWQEARSPAFERLHPEYRRRGWATWHDATPGGPAELAVSWRRRTFELLDVEPVRMHDGGSSAVTDFPFPPRWVLAATFRHRPSGRTLTVLDTHVNQRIETGDRFVRHLNSRRAKVHLRRLAGLWDTVPGELVVGTGDYNFDFVDDSRARPRGGITRTTAGHATSSYQALGLTGLRPTKGTRYIDYVFVADHSLRTRARDRGIAQLATHRVLDGFRSDHAPLLARIRWYAGGAGRR